MMRLGSRCSLLCLALASAATFTSAAVISIDDTNNDYMYTNTRYMLNGGDALSAHAAAPAPAGKASSAPLCSPRSSLKNSSMVTGGKVVVSVLDPYPTLAMADGFCCSMATGNWYTNVDVGPSKKYKDQRDYICTVYVQSGSAAPQIVPGNSSTSAGFSVRPPPPDPQCKNKKTMVDCLGDQPGTFSQCAWSGDQCSYSPPLQCGNFGPKPPLGPFCVGLDLAALPFPSGAAGRTLRSFNWTSGSVGPQHEKVFVQPAQVLTLGNTTWFSVSVDPATGFGVCVTYNELSKDGRSSDPNSGFSACAKFGAGMLDLTRGSTPKIGQMANLGQSNGWTDKGYDPSAGTALWGYFIFWSNSTAVV